jgi:hypothetical protein
VKGALRAFTQLELAGLIGLPDGRYLARDGGAERVLIVETVAATRPSRRRRRRPRQVDPGEPGEVPVTRVTVTAAEELADSARASAWLESVAGDPRRRAAEVRSATLLVNRALHALRAGAGDPLVPDVAATRALAIRIGYGSGEQLAEGRWTAARELPPPKRGRYEEVEPQSRVAAVLAGRDEVHPAETMLLRARLDAEHGRVDEARYGLAAAEEALDRDPGRREEEIRRQLDALRERLDQPPGAERSE